MLFSHFCEEFCCKRVAKPIEAVKAVGALPDAQVGMYLLQWSCNGLAVVLQWLWSCLTVAFYDFETTLKGPEFDLQIERYRFFVLTLNRFRHDFRPNCKPNGCKSQVRVRLEHQRT